MNDLKATLHFIFTATFIKFKKGGILMTRHKDTIISKKVTQKFCIKNEDE